MAQNYCPKCKNAVNETDIRCKHCNMRLKQVCPTCGTANNFGVEFCTNCNTVLLQYCETCGSANFADATVCRKCSAPLKVQEKTQEQKVQLVLNKTVCSKPLNYSKQNIKVIKETDTEEEEKISDITSQPQYEDNQEDYIDNTYEEYEENIQEENIDENLETVEETIEDKYIEEPQQEYSEQIEDNYNNNNNNQEEYIENTQEEEYTEEDYNYQQEQTDYITDDLDIEDSEISNIDTDEEIVCLDDADQILVHLNNIIQTQNNAVVTGFSAEEGMGKSTIVKNFIDSLANQGIISIFAENSELIKVSPFGSIRDALLKLLTLPDMHPDEASFYSENTQQLFAQNFENLNENEILNFMNFLYPKMQSDFGNLAENKEKTHALLEKIFISITSKNNAVFIIDNFDLTDNASFEFIQNIIKKGIINNKTKLFITYREKRSARVYFDKELSSQNIFASLYLNNLGEEKTFELIKGFSNTEYVPTAVSFAVNEKGNGNIFFTEQFLALLFDVGYMFISSNTMKFKDDEPIPFIPKNIDEVVKLRYEAINQAEIKDSLITASIMGYKFDKTAFASVTDITEEQADALLQRLTDLMFIQPVSDYEYAFKNMTMWSIIFNESHKDPRFKVICKKVFYIFGKYALSNPIVKATVAKYRDEEEAALLTWKETAGVSAYLGDENIYSLAMEQFLLQTGYDENLTEFTDVQITAMEQIAKIIYKSNPQKAIKYLTPPVTNAKETENNIKLIDLSAYLIKACYLVSDYNSVIETVDLVVKSAENEISPLEKALILSKKLEALFKTGNCEEGINLANNDIITHIEEALSKENNEAFAQTLFKVWFETSINMVYLYALQGNSKALEIADNTAEIMKMNGIQEQEYTVKMNLAKAFAMTIIGRITESSKIINAIEKIPEYNNKENICKRNLIYAMNMVFSNNTENLREILFDFAKYAENANDQIGKHIYKLMLAWLTAQEDPVQSNVIFNEELTYFAKEKIVTGALISWLFISQNTLMSENNIANAEHIAMKALEVAQNPKFSQYHAAVYLQKLIAEINLMKGDVAAAKMYLEKGMLIAKQFGLDLAQIELYRTYAQFLGYMMTQSNSNQPELADKANKIYQVAIVISDKLAVPGLTNIIKNEQAELVNYCKQNGIAIN